MSTLNNAYEVAAASGTKVARSRWVGSIPIRIKTPANPINAFTVTALATSLAEERTGKADDDQRRRRREGVHLRQRKH